MKKMLIYIITFWGLIIGMNACYEDKGNYDYTSLPQVRLEGLEDECIVIQFDTLKLKPILKSEGDLETDFEYSWRLWSVNAEKMTVISEDKDLVYKATDSPATYNLLLTVHNTQTGVDSYRKMKLTVQGIFGEGWMVLHEKDGKTDFDIVTTPYITAGLTTEKILRGVYEMVNGEVIREHGVRISSTYYSSSKQNIYLLTENGGVRLSYVSMKKDFDVLSMLIGAKYVKPQGFSWIYICPANPGGNALISDGKIYMGLAGGAEFAIPGIKDINLTYYAAPYIVRKHGGIIRYFFYDNLNGRFLRIIGNAYFVEEIPPTPGLLFDLGRMNGHMVYMESGFNNYEYFVLQDFQTNKKTLYVADFTKDSDDKPVASYAMNNCPDIDNARCFAVGSRGHVFYYSVGNKVYSYDYFGKNSAEECLSTLDGMPIVSMKILKSDRGKAVVPPYDNKVLIIATYDEVENAGKVYMYRINESNGTLDKESVKMFDGFGKIIDMDYNFPRYGT